MWIQENSVPDEFDHFRVDAVYSPVSPAEIVGFGHGLFMASTEGKRLLSRNLTPVPWKSEFQVWKTRYIRISGYSTVCEAKICRSKSKSAHSLQARAGSSSCGPDRRLILMAAAVPNAGSFRYHRAAVPKVSAHGFSHCDTRMRHAN